MRNLRHIILLFVLLFTLAASQLGCKRQNIENNQLAKVLERGVLRVGTVYGQSTYYYDASGATGFEYELMKGFAEHLGVKLDVFPYHNLTELMSQVEQQQVQIAAAGIPLTASQLKQVDIGPVYHQVDQKLVYKQGRPRPRKWADVREPLTQVAGASHVALLQRLNQQNPHIEWSESTAVDEEEILQLIKDDVIPFTITDSDTLALMRRRYPELSVAFSVNRNADIAWVLAKSVDDSLQAELLRYFTQLNKSGKLSHLKEKYFGHIEVFNYVDTRAFIRASQTRLPKYIDWFKQYAKTLDWRLVAALAYQESHWKPNAVSPTGVRGLMMLTLGTAKDWGVKSRLNPEQNILAGSKYLSSLINRLPKRIVFPDRLWFALAAYNIGMGHLEDARVITQRQGGNPDLWLDVKQHLPLLRQKKHYKKTKYGYARGDEATIYVANIRRYYDTLSYLYSVDGDAKGLPEAAKQEVK